MVEVPGVGSPGTNDGRGEVSVTLNGRTYVMRPSLEALKRMEALSGRGVINILNRFGREDFSITDVAAVITAGINGNPENPRHTMEQVSQAIYEGGVVTYLVPASQLLSNATKAGPKKGN
jgi:hypothetical protein